MDYPGMGRRSSFFPRRMATVSITVILVTLTLAALTSLSVVQLEVDTASWLLPLDNQLSAETTLLSDSNKLLTGDFLNLLRKVSRTHLIPGVSVAVVRTEGPVEYATWGLSTEVGNPVTTDVSRKVPVRTHT